MLFFYAQPFISESTIRYVFTKLYLISRWINSFILAESRAALSSNLTVVIFFRGANLDFAMINLLSNEPSIICHRAYAHAPNAFSEASLKIINVGSPTEFSGMMDRLIQIPCQTTLERSLSTHFALLLVLDHPNRVSMHLDSVATFWHRQ